ncbi:glucosaminidase domain-containing protein [Daejeonella sp.]|jgi:LysM repeat protein|uniref:glucosaminidase domain-containing protein n=1 Tax=Daejeonella sp. TaxID=2805397 RepID=UPI003785197A
MKNIVILLFSLSILTSSCGLLKRQYSTPVKVVEKPINVSPTTSKTAAEIYIDQFKNIAIREMNNTGIPASITLAQGILESGSGNSKLAKEANNHFGIKCTSDWAGKTILEDDDNKDDCFRVYKSAEDSFRDHSEFLKRKRYAPLFELQKNDYRGWAIGLKTAGYATNPKYADLLISLVERYNLNRFDQAENGKIQIVREEKIAKEPANTIPKEKVVLETKKTVAMKIYEVKPGDTLVSVSKQFMLAIEDLKRLNELENSNLFPGQLLLVSK